MKNNVTLTITSLLSILLTIFHLSDDIVYGISPGKLSNLPVVLVLAVWLYCAVVLVERRSGLVMMLVMSLLASGLPVIHMSGNSGLTAGLKAEAGFFFVSNLYMLGVTAVFSVFLSVGGLRSLRRSPGAGQ